jgi:hypothetical protein
VAALWISASISASWRIAFFCSSIACCSLAFSLASDPPETAAAALLVHLREFLLRVRLLLHALNAADPRSADLILNVREMLL